MAIVDDGHLQFGSRSVSLVPLHRHYLASPQDLPRQVRAFFAAVQGQMAASALAGSWAHARDRILPLLMTSMALNNAQGRTLHEPWVNGLSIGYIMEEALPLTADDAPVGEASDRSITLDDIARWNVTAEELHGQALANLILFSHEHTMQGPRAEGITMLCLGGSAAAGDWRPLLTPPACFCRNCTANCANTSAQHFTRPFPPAIGYWRFPSWMKMCWNASASRSPPISAAPASPAFPPSFSW